MLNYFGGNRVHIQIFAFTNIFLDRKILHVAKTFLLENKDPLILHS